MSYVTLLIYLLFGRLNGIFEKKHRALSGIQSFNHLLIVISDIDAIFWHIFLRDVTLRFKL